MEKKNFEWLAGGGEMAKLIAGLDWSRTPLGPLETWPQSLRTTVSLCLASNFPINIIWGDAHTQVYNDGYRVACGDAHPRAMGEDYRVTWASAWPAIGEPFERALAGETTFLENQRMFLERNGYPEETFFTFSLSPIRDESGKVVGLFHPVTETTATMLSERRTRALRDIADRAGRATAFEEACDLLLDTLRTYELDLPFALLYETSTDRESAHLRGMTGLSDPSPVVPATIAFASDDGWPLGRARTERVLVLDDLTRRYGYFRGSTYPEPIANAFVLPIRAQGVAEPIAFLVIGASPRLPVDEAYRAFIEMLASAAGLALGNARAYAAERARAEALLQLDHAKTAFFSNVSHEFRTPLTLLLGPVEDLLRELYGPLTPALRNELDVVRRNGLRLLKLVNALLEFSRVEAGRSSVALVAVDLGALTRDLASAFRSAIERAGMGFVVDIDPAIGAVPVDRDMWEKIVLNLLSNAFKFTKKGKIRLTLRRADDDVELSVEDTGIGIAAEEVERVFQRFHRVQGASARTHEGSGIGLALVHDLAQLHGGSATVESTLGVGTKFTVRIPKMQDGFVGRDDEPPSSKHAQAFVAEAMRWLPDERTAEPQPPSDERPSVLLADDNADMRDYVRRLLAVRYRVTAVPDGEAALAAARASRPDLVLSDVMMPKMDGAALLKNIRADEALHTIPVVLLTARAGEDETASGLELGADDYLTKPFAACELLARVATHLKMAELRHRAAVQETHERELVATVHGRDEFLAIASHELRTPLTALSLQLRLAERGLPTPEKYEKMIALLQRQADRLARLVTELLDIGRIRTDQLVLEKGPVDLAACVHDVAERFAAALAVAGVELTIRAPSSLVGHWDAHRLEQVLTNLLENATKYAPGAPVLVELSPHDAEAVLTVRDHGPGIAADVRDTIFDRFERAGASRNAGGLGLGLFIARQIVRAHGGTIIVDAPPDGGARFVVRLPLG